MTRISRCIPYPLLKLPLPLLLIAFVSAAGGLAGCDKAAARIEPPPPKVTVRQAELREIADADQYNGWLDALETVEVRARVRGHIDKVLFTDGEIVQKGRVLFELDPRPFESEIGRAQDQLKVYEAQKTAADKDFARQRELLSKGGASQAQVDKTEAEAASYEAQVESSQQEIKRKQLDLEYAHVTAPISGRISRAMLTQGNLVNAGGSDPLLTTIVSVNPIYVYFSVDERALQRFQKIKRGSQTQPTTQTVTLREMKLPFKFGLESDDGYPNEGILDFADNKVDKTTGTITVRGQVNNDQGRLVAGSRVRVRVAVAEAQKLLVVPDTAVLSDQDKKYLLVIDSKNVVQRLDVTLGRLQDDGMRVILPSAGGLKADDWIVTQGLQSARINYPVEPVRPDAPAIQAAK